MDIVFVLCSVISAGEKDLDKFRSLAIKKALMHMI